MTRAEQRALEAYPVKMTPLVYQDLIDQFGGKTEIDVNTYPRCLFQQGYEQAEKELELTWEDIIELEDLMAMVHYEFRNGIGKESFGKEVLEKFKAVKEEQNNGDTIPNRKP